MNCQETQDQGFHCPWKSAKADWVGVGVFVHKDKEQRPEESLNQTSLKNRAGLFIDLIKGHRWLYFSQIWDQGRRRRQYHLDSVNDFKSFFFLFPQRHDGIEGGGGYDDGWKGYLLIPQRKN